MYVVLTKNSNNTWDAISDITLEEGTISKNVLEDAFTSNLPMIGMDITNYGPTVFKNSVFDGDSFSGGITPPSSSPEKQNQFD